MKIETLGQDEHFETVEDEPSLNGVNESQYEDSY